MIKVIFLFVIGILLNCSNNGALKPGQGYLEVADGKIWYQVLGNQKKIPKVLLHDGPCFPCYYQNPLINDN